MTTYAPPFQIILPWTQPFATVGTWTRTQASTYLGGGVYVSPATIDNSVSYRVALGVGTYTLTAIGNVNANAGISTVAIDGTTVGTLDWYAAGLTSNIVKTITGITVTTAGVYTLTLTAATKNASSSAYYQALNLLALHRTDDASGPIVGATLPHRVDIIGWAGTQYAQSIAPSVSQNSSFLGGGRMFNGSVQGCYVEWLVPLAAGTWTFTEIAQTSTDSGIRDYTLNGVAIGSVDWYGATVVNVVNAVAGVTVAQDGIYKLRVTKTNKHASASAYASWHAHIICQRTGA